MGFAAALLAVAPHGAADGPAPPPATVEEGARPRPAPAWFVSANYGIAFASPPGGAHCPLPDGWIGSDHGTVVFLEAPRSCAGAGWPSSSRSFEPGTAARIDLYYAYSMRTILLPEEIPPPPPCRAVGALRFLGALRPVCEEQADGIIRRRVEADYPIGAEHEGTAILTLVTRAERLARDMPAFAAAAASVRHCTRIIREGSRTYREGSGPPCPPEGSFF
jgi:hypothetical protein